MKTTKTAWPWGYFSNGIPKNAMCVCGHDSGVHKWNTPHECDPETEKCDCGSFRWKDDLQERMRAKAPEMAELLRELRLYLEIASELADSGARQRHPSLQLREELFNLLAEIEGANG